MQEEIENRSVNFVISSAKLTTRALLNGLTLAVSMNRDARMRKADPVHARHKGKQTVKELISQDQGATSIDIGRTELRDFERVARKYGIDYAVKRDRSAGQTRYLFFFKAKDTDVLQAAYNEYAAAALKKNDTRQSIRGTLEKFREMARNLMPHDKVRNKEAERSR